MTKSSLILRENWSLTILKNLTTYQWLQWLPQSLKPKQSHPMHKWVTLHATIARKSVIWSKTVKNWKWKKKMPNKAKLPRKKTYPKCGTCGKTNHPEERCWQGAGAHLKPKRTRPEGSSDNNPDSKTSKPHQNPTSSNSQSSSKKDESKTNFTTTPVRPTRLCSTVHQIGPSNANFPQL